MKTKVLLSLFFLASLVGIVLQSQLAHAEEQQQTIVVTSLNFDNKEDLQVQSAPGREIAPLKNAHGINGKTFQLYDVTELFRTFMQSEPEGTTEQINEAFIKQLSEEQLAASSVTTTTTQTTSFGDGTAVFNVTRADEQGFHVYFLKELGSVNKIAPVLIRLPILDLGKELNPIHLYTKNVVKIEPEYQPKLKKRINNLKDSYSYGDIIDYSVEFAVPSKIKSAESFSLVDTYDPGLTRYGTPTLWLGDQPLPASLFSSQTTGQQTIYTFDPKALSNYIGKPLRINYQMQLTNASPDSSHFTNTVKLMINQKEVLQDHQTIRTGGKHFMKIEALTNTPLANARFYVTNKSGLILSLKDGHYQWSKDLSDAWYLLSNQQGAFQLNGLADGTYNLHEQQAPPGYLLSSSPVPFTVNKDSFESSALEIINKKATNSSEEVPPHQPVTIDKSVSPSLGSPVSSGVGTTGKTYPATGETLSPFMIVTGLLFVTVALGLSLKGVKKNEHKN